MLTEHVPASAFAVTMRVALDAIEVTVTYLAVTNTRHRHKPSSE